MTVRPQRGQTGFVALAITVVVASCSGSTVPTRDALPPSTPIVDVDMSEFRFVYTAPIQAGRIVFRVHNVGSLTHEMDLIPLSEDLPPINEQLHGTERHAVAPFASARPRPPGTTGATAADLVYGRRYAMVCFVFDRVGKQVHALKGMNSEFRAGGPDAKPPPSTTPGPAPLDPGDPD